MFVALYYSLRTGELINHQVEGGPGKVLIIAGTTIVYYLERNSHLPAFMPLYAMICNIFDDLIDIGKRKKVAERSVISIVIVLISQ